MAENLFLELILRQAIASGLAHGIQQQRQRPPPDNYFVLSDEKQAWEEFKEANAKENMVVCIEFVPENLSKSTVFMDLARENEGIPFLRVIKVDSEGIFDTVQADIGGVSEIPSIVIVFFDKQKKQRVKFEGVNEIIKGVESGKLNDFIKELVSRRVKLIMEKEMQEKYEAKEQQLREQYEEKMRLLTEKEEDEAKANTNQEQSKDEVETHEDSATHNPTFLEMAFANILARGSLIAHDRQEVSLRPPPDNYFVLSREDPTAWKQFKEDSIKENLVFCVEFIDEDMSSTVFIELAREFNNIPFVRVQVGLGADEAFKEVRKDVGGVESTPSIVVFYFDRDCKKLRAKFEGVQEIQNGLRSGKLKEVIRDLISRRVTLKNKEDVEHQVRDKEQLLREEYNTKMRELEERLSAEKKEKVEVRQRTDSEKKTFCESMSPTELAEWLLEDLGTDFKDDIKKLQSNNINGSIFLQLPCDEEGLKCFGFSYGFKALLPSKVKQLKPREQEETDQAFIHWKKDDTKVLRFSEMFGPSDLALWLLQEIGDDYKDDIAKLQRNKINAKLFLQLKKNSRMKDDLNLTYGFNALIYDLIEKVKEADKEEKMPIRRIESIKVSEPTTQQESSIQSQISVDQLKITRNPRSLDKPCKQGTVLTVRASGPGTLRFQWMKDEEPMTDDTLADCTGSTSDSLRFTNLLPKHSGSYKCRVSNDFANVESKSADLKVQTTVKFTDFITQSSEFQDGHVTISEILEECFMAYLQRYGYTYSDDPKRLETILSDIHTSATVKYDDAIVDFETRKQVDVKLENYGEPKVYINRETEDRYHTFQRNVTYAVGSESATSKWQGWSTSGGLSASYQGAGASGTVGYERGKAEAFSQSESVQRTEAFDETILVPSETRVKVAVEKQFVVYNCNVNGLIVTFKKNKSQIKCQVKFGPKEKTSNETFKLKRILEKNLISDDNKSITVRMNGKCVWSETRVYLRRYPSEPLQAFRDVV